MTPPGITLSSRQRTDALLDFGDTVESVGGRYITAEDVGTSSRDMRVIAQRTRHVAGLAAAAGRVRRPQPVHRARRGVGDTRVLRAGVRLRRAARPDRGGDRARACRLARRQAVRARRRDPRAQRHRPAQAPAGRGARRQAGPRPTARSSSTSTYSRPARWAGCSTTTRCPRCAAGSSPARRTTSWPTSRSRTCWRRETFSGRPDFVANAGGIINIAEELDGYDPAAAPPSGAPDRRDPASRSSTTPRRHRHHAARGREELARARLQLQTRLHIDIYLDIDVSRYAMTAARPRGQPALSRPACRGGRPGVDRRGGRSAAGTSLQASSSNSSTVRFPCVERGEEPTLALEPVRDVLVELRRGFETGGPCPGHSTSSGRSRSRPRAVEVVDQRARVGEMNTLPSPSTASPVSATEPVEEREVVGRVARGRQRPRTGRT